MHPSVSWSSLCPISKQAFLQMAGILLPKELIVGKDNYLEVKGDLHTTCEMMDLMTLPVFFSNEY